MQDIATYTQMGYTEEQVLKAKKYSQQKNIDMFDALQILQNQDKPDSKSHKKIPSYSYLIPLSSLNISDYEVIYHKNGLRSVSISREEIRQPNIPVGLLNVSNCCYLNSLLQCYFLMGNLTREILQAQLISQLPDQHENRVRNKRIEKEYHLIQALKDIFSRLKLSSKKYLDPSPVLSNLVNSVGQKIEYGDEKDLNEINMCIVERLSEGLMYSKKYYSSNDESPSKHKKNQSLKKLFYGTKIQYTEGSEESSEMDFLGLLLQPKDGSLLTAMDNQLNYEVEIEGEKKKRTTYMKELPYYLWININRTGFLKSKNKLLRNEEKISFDFVIYMDRYMDKNKEQSKLVSPKITQLLRRKDFINNQINHLELLATKLDECRHHAQYLSGWEEKLPNTDELMKQKNQFIKDIQTIEAELVEIQSRKQKFVLMYLFVHRGDAISGHYWGYGRNGDRWYRFDINCSSINQSEILIDMQKSGGIPYAMVYVRDNEIQKFPYTYHIQHTQDNNLLNLQQNHLDYCNYIPPQKRNKIIEQNLSLHEVMEKQSNQNIVKGVIQDYQIKFNLITTQGQQFAKCGSSLPNYQNFTLFLHSLKQLDFMKYHIYSVCVYDRSEMSTVEMLDKDILLKALQKNFRKQIKDKMILRHFAIECEPEEGKRYHILKQDYVLGKKCTRLIELMEKSFDEWPKKQKFEPLLDAISSLIRDVERHIYVKSLVREFLVLLLLDLAKRKEKVKDIWVKSCNQKNPLLMEQIKALTQTVADGNICLDMPKQLEMIEVEKTWKIESLKKVSGSETVEKVRIMIKHLGNAVDIYKMNIKEGKIWAQQESHDLI